MKTLVSMIVALGLSAASNAPAFAADDQHKADKAECQKNHMKWDQQAIKCVPGTGEKGKEETPPT
jgi:hypothetical protein